MKAATRYQRGQKWVTRSALAMTVVALIGLLTWQFSNASNLQRSSRAQPANAEVNKAVEQVGLAQLIEPNVRFTRPNIEGQNTLLATVYVQRKPGVKQSDEEISSRIKRAVQKRLKEKNFNVTPLIDVTVLESAR